MTSRLALATTVAAIVLGYAAVASAQTYEVTKLVPGSAFHGVHGLGIDKSGRLFAGSVAGAALYEVDRSNGTAKIAIPSPEGMADDIAFAPDGTMAWTAFLTGDLYSRKGDGPVKKLASGNGVVEKVGWEGGYGKYVRLKHNNGYETAYGHMSAFAKGMEPGKRVRQGQVIGFVGSTGMSTGAHVHYEILVNGRFVDPMRVKLPRGRSLEGAVMTSFEKERDRLDTQMNNRGSAARVSEAAGAAPQTRQVSR